MLVLLDLTRGRFREIGIRQRLALKYTQTFTEQLLLGFFLFLIINKSLVNSQHSETAKHHPEIKTDSFFHDLIISQNFNTREAMDLS